MLIVLVFSCNKESSYPYKFAGAWQIDKVDIEYYSNQGSTVDSSKTYSNPGVILLKNITDNDFENDKQIAQLIFNSDDVIPPGIAEFCIKAGLTDPKNIVVNYVAGPHGTERLTLWTPMESLHELIIYTVPKLSKKEMELTYYLLDSEGNLIRSEYWYCSIKE